MERVLITGAGGFIGRHVLERAVKEPSWELYAVSSGRRPAAFPPGVHVVTADLRRQEACEEVMRLVRPDIVLHLAWNLEERGFLMRDENLLWLEISLRLLRAFHTYGVGRRRFVFSGSSAEYGYAQSVCREDGAAEPEDLYGLCKLRFEDVARLFCEPRGIQFAAIRYFSVYGPGESRLLHIVPVAIDTLLRGQPFVCRYPNNLWDYVFIDDVSQATVTVLRSDLNGAVNVAAGAVSMRELTTIIAREADALQCLSFENEDLPPRTLVADTTRLQTDFGCRCEVGIGEGLARTVRWWRERGA